MKFKNVSYIAAARSEEAKQWRELRTKNPKLARFFYFKRKESIEKSLDTFWNDSPSCSGGIFDLLK